MAKKVETKNLELFTLIVNELKKVDKEEQVHILTNVINWLRFDLNIGAANKVTPSSVSSFSDDAQSTVSIDEVSPKLFLIEKAPETNVERVACLAFYLTHHRESPHFKTLDLSRLNTEAAQPKFSNASMTVNDAAKSGFLVSAGKGNKQLSAVGEQFVSALPDRESAKEILSLHRKRKSRKRTKTKKKLK